MNNEQNQLPDGFNVKLQKHGEDWHVTSIHKHQYPIGDATKQPAWDVVRGNLEKIGYEVSHEPDGNAPGQRVVSFARTEAPSIFERLGQRSDEPLPTVEPLPAHNEAAEMVKRKFGKL
jgi:hypothetical protein